MSDVTVRPARQLAFFTYACFVILAGAAFCVVFWDRSQVLLPGVAVFAVLTWFSETIGVDLPHHQLTASVSTALTVAVLLLFGPGAMVLTTTLATIRVKDLRGTVPLVNILFNRGQLALSAGLAAITFQQLGGHVGTLNHHQILAALGGGAIHVLMNLTIVCVALSLQSGWPLRSIWARNTTLIVPQAAALICLGVLLAMVYTAAGFVGVLLITVPLGLTALAFRQYSHLKEALLGSITSLVLILEARDPYTHGHSARTTEYALAIARKLGWQADSIERFRYTCLLHDIGKIGIPDALIRKPSSLDPDEYEIVKGHAELGATVVNPLAPSLDPKWILHHHERYDGGGYPVALMGEAIPLGARILALADAFDAMTTDRPYRQARTTEQALQEVRACSGTQFDPRVVEAFLAVVPLLALPGRSSIERVSSLTVSPTDSLPGGPPARP